MWPGERFTGEGPADLINRTRTGKPLTYAQFIVANLGMLPGERLFDTHSEPCGNLGDRQAFYRFNESSLFVDLKHDRA
jgi:hypothetical protein